MTFLILLAVIAIVGVLLLGTAVQIGLILVVGGLAGVLARAVIPGRQDLSVFQTVFLGVGGIALMSVMGALFGFDLDAGIWTGAVGATIILALFLYLKSHGLLCLGGLLFVLSLSGCISRLGPGPQRVANAVVSGPVRIDLARPITDLPPL